MATVIEVVTKLRQNAEVAGRNLMTRSQNRVREVTTAALERTEKVLGAAQERVRKARLQITKPDA